jgi:iron complex transport system ATP-binding protein
MLEARALAFGYTGRNVGCDVSFTLAPGEVLCVLGPNGSGKTTLFKTVLGLLPPHGGTVALDGADLRSLSRVAIARLAGYVPQGYPAYFAYTVREFALMGRAPHVATLATPGRHDRDVAIQALHVMGIAALADRALTEISAGERQLALIARALAQEARVLIMDEPTASLDFGNQVRVLQKIEELARQGIAIAFSTHDPDHAFLAAQRALLLAEGRMLALGTPREVIREETLERLYKVSVQVLAVPGGMHTCLPRLEKGAGPFSS